jgi:hypothetical protein
MICFPQAPLQRVAMALPKHQGIVTWLSLTL